MKDPIATIDRFPHRSLFGLSPAAWLLSAYAAGIFAAAAAGDRLAGRTGLLAAIGGVMVLAALAAAVFPRCGGRRVGVAGGLIALSCFGAAAFMADSGRTAIRWPDAPERYRLMVMDAPQASPRSVRFTARVIGGPADGAAVSCRLGTAGRPTDLLPGDVIAIAAAIRPPVPSGNPGTFDYATWLRRQGVGGTAFCPAGRWCHLTASTASPPLAVRALRLRSRLVSRYARHFDGAALGIVTALTLGDRTHLDAGTRQRFADGGVSHVLALSGLHLSILFSLYQLVVLRHCRRRLARGAAALVGIGGLWAFSLLAGMPLSLLRAAVMFSLVQLMGLFRHDTLSAGNLMLAGFILLVAMPQAALDVGLQLSFLSVLAIVRYVHLIPLPGFVMRRRLLRYVYGLLVVSFVAQTATAPLVAYYFHSLPLYGLPVNALVVPAAYPLLALSVIFAAVPPLQPLLAVVMRWLLNYVEGVLEMFTALPFASISCYVTAATTLMLYVAILLAVRACRSRFGLWRRHLLVAALAVVAVAVTGEAVRRRSDALPPQMVFVNLPRTAAVHLVSDTRHSVLWLPGAGAAADSLARLPALHDLWAARAMRRPIIVGGDTAVPGFYVRGTLALFAGQRLAAPADTLPRHRPATPMAVDVLLLPAHYRPWPERTFKTYRPRLIILPADFTDAQRTRYATAARTLGIPVHDMATDGAITIPIGKGGRKQ